MVDFSKESSLHLVYTTESYVQAIYTFISQYSLTKIDLSGQANFIVINKNLSKPSPKYELHPRFQMRVYSH